MQKRQLTPQGVRERAELEEFGESLKSAPAPCNAMNRSQRRKMRMKPQKRFAWIPPGRRHEVVKFYPQPELVSPDTLRVYEKIVNEK